MNFKTLNEARELKSKRVLVRVDFNVPIKEGKVIEDYRIQESLPTIKHLIESGSKVILISHIESKDGSTLKPVYEHLSTLVDFPISYCENILGTDVEEGTSKISDGEAILLGNLRDNPGEKENSGEFAKSLSNFGDIFVNEAFSASHRNHASIVGIPKFLPSFAGLRFSEEVERLSKAFHPKHPFLFILGGAKFDTKLPLIEKFLAIADYLFVGGALAHNFFKEQGKNLGDSLVSSGDFNLEEKYQTGKIILPVDMIIKGGDGMGVDTLDHVGTGDIIMDAGPHTLEILKEKIDQSQFILWNGPLGNYELGYKDGTLALAKELSQSKAEVIVGGADTLASIKELGISKDFSFISTGGGAMLDFLAKETLPGIEALKREE